VSLEKALNRNKKQKGTFFPTEKNNFFFKSFIWLIFFYLLKTFMGKNKNENVPFIVFTLKERKKTYDFQHLWQKLKKNKYVLTILEENIKLLK
jgi:hypothetical protein